MKKLTFKEQKEIEILQKKRQILYSWSIFYSNSKSGLLHTRYHKIAALDKFKKLILHDVFINDLWNTHYNDNRAIKYSKRYSNDIIQVNKINKEIEENQLNINKYYN